MPALEDVACAASNLFWQRVKAQKPDLEEDAKTTYLQLKKARVTHDENRAVYLSACNKVFTEGSEDVLRSTLLIFALDDCPLSQEADSKFKK